MYLKKIKNNENRVALHQLESKHLPKQNIRYMPGAFARTSTFALTNATLPYALKIANLGYQKAIISNPAIARRLNIIEGKVTYQPVADTFSLPYYPVNELSKDL